MAASPSSSKKKEGWFDFMTWRFVASKIFEGIFQGIGAILVYATVIWIVISGYIGNGEFKNAIALKTGGIVNPNGPSASVSNMDASSGEY